MTIPWRYPKRGELPEVGDAVVVLDTWFCRLAKYKVTASVLRALKKRKTIVIWCYSDEFPWPEDLEDEKSEKMR